MPDEAQPNEGQGQDGGGLFDSYLQTVPEDGRETVEAYLRDASKQVNGKLEQAADLEKTWGPYQQVEALQQYQPEQLNELLGWHQQVATSDDAYKEWLKNAATEAGFELTEKEAQEAVEDEGGIPGEFTQAQIQQLADERIQAQLEQTVAPIQQQMQEWQEQRDIDNLELGIRDELPQLEDQGKMQLTEAQKAMVLDLGLDYKGEGSWVKYGFDRFKEIHAEAARMFVDQKTQQPGPSLTAGGTGAFKPTTNFAEAKEQLRERWRQDQST